VTVPAHKSGGRGMAPCHGERSNGGLGSEPQRGPGAELMMVRGSEGKPLLKLKHFWLFGIQCKPQICPLF